MSRYTDVCIDYDMYDRTAAKDAALDFSAPQNFCDITELHNEEGEIKKWATGEKNQWILDESFLVPPDDLSAEFMGIWSSSQSDENGAFSVPLVLTALFTEAHTSAGITLIFDPSVGEWCSDLTITWYDKTGTVISTKNFAPDRPNYSCENQVDNYYKISITFRKTNLPYRFLKLTGIRYGLGLSLSGDRILSASILEELDPISSEVRINTLNFRFFTPNGAFNILSPTGVYASLQQRQRIRVTGWVNSTKLNMGTFYLSEPTAETDDTTAMSCTDLLGVIDSTEFMGGMWQDGIAAGELVKLVFASAGEPNSYELDPMLATIIVRGHLPIASHRAALQQIAFAIGGVVDCSRSDKVKIVQNKRSYVRQIGGDRKIVGHTQKQREIVTGVEVYEHKYILPISANSTELYKGTGALPDIIKFSRPMGSIVARNAAIKEWGVNYAKLSNPMGEVVLEGVPYEKQTYLGGAKYMPDLPAQAKANVLTVEDATLFADSAALANRIYDYYQNRIVDTGSIILGYDAVGEKANLMGGSSKNLTGVIESIETDLTGGFISTIKMVGSALK